MAAEKIEVLGVTLEVDFDDFDDLDVVAWMGEIQGGVFTHYKDLYELLFGPEQLEMLREKLGTPNSRGRKRLRNSDMEKVFEAFIAASEKAKN